MINKLFAFFFIAYLLSSCVEDIENYALGNVDNMIPDGKELMELRLVIPGDKQPVARSIENGTAGENRIEQLYMDVMDGGGNPIEYRPRSTGDGTLKLTHDGDSVYVVSTLFDIGTLKDGYTLRVPPDHRGCKRSFRETFPRKLYTGSIENDSWLHRLDLINQSGYQRKYLEDGRHGK